MQTEMAITSRICLHRNKDEASFFHPPPLLSDLCLTPRTVTPVMHVYVKQEGSVLISLGITCMTQSHVNSTVSHSLDYSLNLPQMRCNMDSQISHSWNSVVVLLTVISAAWSTMETKSLRLYGFTCLAWWSQRGHKEIGAACSSS